MKKVLIVDDETEIVQLMMWVLSGCGAELLTAYDGEEALRIIQLHRPEIVLTDVMMPRLDGRELCHRIKTDAATKDIVVILMSAFLPRNSVDSCADCTFTKPFDIVEVSQTIEAYLAKAA